MKRSVKSIIIAIILVYLLIGFFISFYVNYTTALNIHKSFFQVYFESWLLNIFIILLWPIFFGLRGL